jgi:hypothetical protein
MIWATGTPGRQRAPPESNRGDPPAMVGHQCPSVLGTVRPRAIATPHHRDHRRAHRGEGLPLAVHPLPGTSAHLRVPGVGAGVLRRRRHERRAAGAAARGLRAAQQPVPGGPFPQHADPRRLVRLSRRLRVLVPRGQPPAIEAQHVERHEGQGKSPPARPRRHVCPLLAQGKAVALPYRGVFRRKAQVSSGSFCSDMLAGTTSAPFRNNQVRLVPCTSRPNTTTE